MRWTVAAGHRRNADGGVSQIGAVRHGTTALLIVGRRDVAGSIVGGVAKTQEMLDFCARKDILPDCEIVPLDAINEVFDRFEHADARYRFVIEMSTPSKPRISGT